MLDAFDQCFTNMLSMPTPMRTFFRTRLYRKMFLDFARHELASTQITTLDDLVGISGVQFQNIVCHFMRNGGATLSHPLRSDILFFEIAG